MADIIIIAIIVVIVLAGLSSSVRHFRGEGGCCGGSTPKQKKKKLDAPKMGERKILIEGMHCDNCKNSVERAINKIDGASCTVDLKKKTAHVSYSKEIADEILKQAVEELGFEVKSIEK